MYTECEPHFLYLTQFYRYMVGTPIRILSNPMSFISEAFDFVEE